MKLAQSIATKVLHRGWYVEAIDDDTGMPDSVRGRRRHGRIPEAHTAFESLYAMSSHRRLTDTATHIAVSAKGLT